MPLEVRQIGIRLNVGDVPSATCPGAAGDPAGPGIGPAERAAIIDECVEAVLYALKMARER
jgi:Family of unknown function (DUF5908)